MDFSSILDFCKQAKIDIGMKVLKEQFAQDLKAMKSGKTVSRMAR